MKVDEELDGYVLGLQGPRSALKSYSDNTTTAKKVLIQDKSELQFEVLSLKSSFESIRTEFRTQLAQVGTDSANHQESWGSTKERTAEGRIQQDQEAQTERFRVW